MNIQTTYQNLKSSPWTEQFIEKRVSRLSRFLGQSATVQVLVKFENQKYFSSLAIHNSRHDFSFTAEAENFYESFSLVLDKASRALVEEKRKLKDRINKKYFSIDNESHL